MQVTFWKLAARIPEGLDAGAPENQQGLLLHKKKNNEMFLEEAKNIILFVCPSLKRLTTVPPDERWEGAYLHRQ